MGSINTGVILAAGRGNRLKELSADKPKPLVEINEKSILSNLVEAMIDNGLKRIVLVVGYKAKMLKEHLQQYSNAVEIIYVTNEIYDTTNNIYSLWLAKDYLDRGFYLFEADVYFEPALLRKLFRDSEKNVMVIDRFTDKMNGSVVALDQDSFVTKLYLKRDQTNAFDFSDKYKTVNFYKIDKDFYQNYFGKKLNVYIEKNDVSYFYEAIIKDGIREGYRFFGLRTEPYKWWEIDTKEDLKIARKLFGQLG